MKIREILKNGMVTLAQSNVEDALMKARMLLLYEIGMENEYIALHMDDEVGQEIVEEFNESIQEIAEGKPIQYILKEQEFYGLKFYVDENVLIPQPDTEILVEEVLQFCSPEAKVLEVGTGSGAIAIVLQKRTKAELVASDISYQALEIAQKNANTHRANITFVQSDMFQNLTGKFDLIVSNPPYIETEVIKNLSEEVKNEPRIALDGGKDGLDFYRILTQEAPNYLNPNGILAVEIGYQQKEKVMELFEKAGFCEVYSKKDYGNHDRIVVGKWGGK